MLVWWHHTRGSRAVRVAPYRHGDRLSLLLVNNFDNDFKVNHLQLGSSLLHVQVEFQYVYYQKR